jgi:hypothetical protein
MFQTEGTTQSRRASRPLAEVALVVATRIAALFALVVAIIIAARLIGLGVADLDPMRFDTVPPGPRTVLLCTALCAAASGLGLWSLARWGAMLWVAASAALIYMHALRADVYGDAGRITPLLASIILVQILVYAWALFSRRTLSLR